MVTESSATKKMGFNKWREVFLIFIIIYAAALVFNLGTMTIQWDEATHLNGGLLLLHGSFSQYIQTNSFYPPMLDLVIAGFYGVMGASVLTARLVVVTFSLLSVWAVFEIANRMYGARTALLAAVLFGTMPGFFWISRITLIETMLIFFFIIAMLFFFNWLQANRNRDLFISAVAVGLGFLVKYQMLIAGVIMIIALLLLARDRLRSKLVRFPILIVTVGAIITPWFLAAYQTYASSVFSQWVYALEIGNPQKTLYSVRYPLPIFYLIEIVWPYSNAHPISILVYALSLAGIGFLAWRRRPEDKYLIIWFIVIYVFFTLITNRQWRYVIPLFPVLAIAASTFILATYDKTRKILQSTKTTFTKRRLIKIAASLFIIFSVTAIVYSAYDAYSWVAQDNQVQIPLQQATQYALAGSTQSQSIMLVCPFNYFSKEMVRFYVTASGTNHNLVWQYPDLPVDATTPNFNITEFIQQCHQYNSKYIFLYEYGTTVPYFNTTLTLHKVYEMLYYSGNFTYQTSFGIDPRRIFIMTFTP
jgi:4-amino-4-deoxy-L-arabinose transferase-like glycosyltransferase